MKNKTEGKINKNSKKESMLQLRAFVFAVFIVLLAVVVVSRVIPDGSYRLVLGESVVGEKAIALTFDDGPSGNTEELLDGLSRYGAKVSFFVLGKKAEKNPEIVKRAYAEGHLIGNHTYDHIRMPFFDYDTVSSSVGKTYNIIKDITGEETVYLRAPYGDVTALQLKRLDSVFIGWSTSSYDWQNKDADYIYERLMSTAADGEIILLHDTKKATVDAVLKAIPELQAQGYEFVRVDELLTRNGHKLKLGVIYRNCEYEHAPFIF